jgi:hypothetical protein
VVEHLRSVEQLLGEPQGAPGIAREQHPLGDGGVGAEMDGAKHAFGE